MEERSREHIKLQLYISSIKTDISTILSHGTKSKELHKPLIVKVENFKKLVDCDMSGSDYIRLLAEDYEFWKDIYNN